MHTLGAGQLRMAARYNLLGRLVILYRTADNGPTAENTTASDGLRQVYVVRNTGSALQSAATGDSVYSADWLLFARLGQDLQAGDIVSDGTLAYVLTGNPTSDQGCQVAPVEPSSTPETPAAALPALRIGAQRGARIGF